MTFERDTHSHRRYVVWCEWEPKVDLEKSDREPLVTEGALVCDPKEVEGKPVGPATLINILEGQGLTVKWMVPVPYHNLKEDA
jgi:hypothetical protein